MRHRAWGVLALAACVVALVGGCGAGGSGTAPTPSPTVTRITGSTVLPPITRSPDVGALLAHPVATPRVCPPNTDAVTSGLGSPWIGTVDLSVFTKLDDTAAQVAAVGRALRSAPRVKAVYFESQHEAFEEFERLYTCSSQVSAATLPASWRVAMTAGTTIAQRNALVARTQVMPGVEVVSCDPRVSCVSTVRRVDPSITASPAS